MAKRQLLPWNCALAFALQEVFLKRCSMATGSDALFAGLMILWHAAPDAKCLDAGKLAASLFMQGP
ncbi:hypothetical protein VM1G_06694 [Cytospora mali]|uniref:Uncharacterized protein n=1 Tax=Cytospora mali TaxID=578113 RepID=A0A194W5J0_CYTMA|nr:hypothetical protein VM1G_06694 [Valsa mali]